MRIILLFICFAFSLYSCNSSKIRTTKTSTVKTKPLKSSPSNKKSIVNGTSNIPDNLDTDSSVNLVFNIIDYAYQFEGVKYKYGGNTKKGIDCSGLIFESFKAYDILLPRSSRVMATEGVKINIDDVKEGDLLFFHTNPKKRKAITHVGLVVTSRTGLIEFIHASTQAGVIVSSLAERYWFTSFAEARRIL